MKMRGFLNFGIAVFAALMLSPFVGAQEVQELQDPPGVRALHKICVTATCSTNPSKSAYAVGCSAVNMDGARANARDKALQLLGSCSSTISYVYEECNDPCPFSDPEGGFPYSFSPCPGISTEYGDVCWEVVVQGTSRGGRVLIVAGYGRNRNQAYCDAKRRLCKRAQVECACIRRICIQSAIDYCAPANCQPCHCGHR